MNKYILVLWISINVAFGQVKSELSSFLISERFQIHNGLVHYKVWSIFDLIIQNARDFAISDNQMEALINAKSTFFPVDYLLREEEHWITKSYRSIPLNHTYNNDLKLDANTLKGFEKLTNTRFYSTGLLDQILTKNDLQNIKWEDMNEIVLREDWVYNRLKGKMESFVTSIGFAKLNNGLRSYLAWANFSSFSSDFTSLFPKNKLITFLKNKQVYSDIFYTYMDDMEKQINLLGREYSIHTVLMEIQKIEELLKLPKVLDKKGNVNWEDKNLYLKIKGNYFNGKLEVFNNQNNLILELNYMGNVLNGPYCLYYSDGNIREKGTFINGLKQGECLSYYNTKYISAKRFFDAGIMDGEQREYYSNGSPAVVYNFQNGFLNGEFNQYYKDGTLMQNGFFVNGLINGEWTYNLIIPKVLRDVIQINPSYFDKKFILEKKWTSERFKGKVFTFKALVEQIQSNECIQGVCTQVEIQ